MKIESGSLAHIDTYYYLKVRPLNEVKLVYSYDLPLGEVTSLYLSKNLRLKIFAEQKDNLPACIQDGPSSLVDFLAGSSIQVSLFKLRKFSGIKKGRQVTEYLLLTNKALSSKGLQRFAVAYGLRSIHLMILNSY